MAEMRSDDPQDRETPEGSSHSTRSTPKDLESPRISQTRRVAKARRVYLGIMCRDRREKPSFSHPRC